MKQLVMTVEEQLAAALAEVENLRMTIAEKDCIIQDLQNKLLWLRKKVFGQMSEKALPVDPSSCHCSMRNISPTRNALSLTGRPKKRKRQSQRR